MKYVKMQVVRNVAKLNVLDALKTGDVYSFKVGEQACEAYLVPDGETYDVLTKDGKRMSDPVKVETLVIDGVRADTEEADFAGDRVLNLNARLRRDLGDDKVTFISILNGQGLPLTYNKRLVDLVTVSDGGKLARLVDAIVAATAAGRADLIASVKEDRGIKLVEWFASQSA